MGPPLVTFLPYILWLFWGYYYMPTLFLPQVPCLRNFQDFYRTHWQHHVRRWCPPKNDYLQIMTHPNIYKDPINVEIWKIWVEILWLKQTQAAILVKSENIVNVPNCKAVLLWSKNILTRHQRFHSWEISGESNTLKLKIDMFSFD